MSQYRNAYGMDAMPGWEFGHVNSGVREFIRTDGHGSVTHRLFVYPGGESPGQLEMGYQTSGMPRLAGYTYGTNGRAYEHTRSGYGSARGPPRLARGGKTRKNK